jgi:polyamine oxidase
MGASWIHGDTNNPVADILKKEGNTLKLTDFENMSIYKDTKKEDFDEISSDFWDFAYGQIEVLEKDISVAEALRLYTKKYSLSEQEKEYLFFRIKVDIETEFGESIEKISLFSLDE